MGIDVVGGAVASVGDCVAIVGEGELRVDVALGIDVVGSLVGSCVGSLVGLMVGDTVGDDEVGEAVNVDFVN